MKKDSDKSVRQESPVTEDATQYGEFIARFHKWPTFEIQQRRSEHLAEVTKDHPHGIQFNHQS